MVGLRSGQGMIGRRGAVALSVIAVLAAGCESSSVDDGPTAAPTASEPAGSETEALSPEAEALDGTAALDAVYAAVEGLSREERTAKLLELAAEEDGLDIYGGTNLQTMDPMLSLFEDLYGIEPNYYSGSSTSVRRRLEQEVDAGFAGNDVIQMNAPDLVELSSQGQLANLTTPVAEDIVASGVYPDWVAMYLTTYIAGWNGDLVDDPPTTYTELFTEFEGRLAFEISDWPWFATITKEHFVGELGMTEDEVVAMMKEAAQGASVLDGHTLMAELLVAGEFDAASGLFHHRVADLRADGAPLEWEPALEPIIARPTGVAVMRHVRNPASALLWVDFLLTDGQQVFVDNFRDPASTKIDGGVSSKYEPIAVDLEAIANERDKWEGLWNEIVESVGG